MVKKIILFCLGGLPSAIVYLWFNLTRFNSIFDRSLFLWYIYDGNGLAAHRNIPGPFSIHFLPSNIYNLFFLGWGFSYDRFPWIHPQGVGQALLLTSPAFVLCLRASLKELETWMLWLAIVLISIPSLTVYAGGFTQFGMRYYVQIFPFLLVLLAKQPIDQITKILIFFSIILVTFGVWHIHVFYFG